MSVPLIEDSGGAAVADSHSSERFSSASSTASSSRASDRRDLVTVHAGDGFTLAKEDLELVLVLVQTILLLAWVYTEVVQS